MLSTLSHVLHMSNSDSIGDKIRGPEPNQKTGEIWVRPRNRRDDRRVGDVDVVRAADSAVGIDDRPECAGAYRVRVARQGGADARVHRFELLLDRRCEWVD